jgi:hypothetical protein
MRNGSRSLREFPLNVVRMERERCGRAGSYRRDSLVARLGADAAPSCALRRSLASVEWIAS